MSESESVKSESEMSGSVLRLRWTSAGYGPRTRVRYDLRSPQGALLLLIQIGLGDIYWDMAVVWSVVVRGNECDYG